MCTKPPRHAGHGDTMTTPRQPASEWYGWGQGDIALYIGPLPGRKSIALYSMEGNRYTPLAYFRDKEKARKARDWLDSYFIITTHKPKQEALCSP